MKILHDTKDVEHAIVELLREAENEAWLVSPYTSLDKLAWLKRAIQDTLDRKVKVHLFVREDGIKTREAEREAADLVELGLDMRCVPDLHAKAYWSEKSAILTSLNLLASSMNNSIEIGVRIDASEAHAEVKKFIESRVVRYAEEMPERRRQREKAEEAERKAERDRQREIEREAERARQLEAARLRELELQAELERARERARQREEEKAAKTAAKAAERPATPEKNVSRKASVPSSGHCIRCSEAIPLDPSRPYCDKDYASWRRYENEDYEDKFCHACGKKNASTMRKPLCWSCYKEGVAA